jgi:hypothetical protein
MSEDGPIMGQARVEGGKREHVKQLYLAREPALAAVDRLSLLSISSTLSLGFSVQVSLAMEEG